MRWSKNETIGFLHRFWWTVLEVSPSGDITALSSPEVMAEMLDMPVEVVARALKAMENQDPKLAFLERKAGRILVHDWLEYAGRYLKDSRFRRSPEKYEEIERIHAAAVDSPPGPRLSADSPPTVRDTLPTLPNPPIPAQERARVEGFRPEVRSHEAVAHAAARKVEAQGQMTNAIMDRALIILGLYPTKAKKDGRVIAKTLADQNALAYRILANPDYPWEEHARLMSANGTPPDLRKWVETMPDPISLDTLREATKKATPVIAPNFSLSYKPTEDEPL